MADPLAYKLRPARAEDADEIIELWKGFVGFLAPRDPRFEARPGAYEKWRDYFLNRMLDSEHAALFVAERTGGDAGRAGELVGVIEARTTGGHPVFKVSMHGHLYGHFVKEDARGHGIGEALVEAAEAWFRGKGLPYYRVSVLSWLPGVREAYEAMDMDHAEWVMEKSLD